jgi:hypothetical protein
MKLRNKSANALKFEIDGVVHTAEPNGPVTPELHDAKAKIILATMTSLPLEADASSSKGEKAEKAEKGHSSDPWPPPGAPGPKEPKESTYPSEGRQVGSQRK